MKKTKKSGKSDEGNLIKFEKCDEDLDEEVADLNKNKERRVNKNVDAKKRSNMRSLS